MYSSDELLDSIITGMYEMFKALISGNYTGFCALFADIISKLAALRKGLKSEAAAKEKTIRELEKQLERATAPAPAGPGEEVIGGETTTYDFRDNAGEGK